jgi:hypothetical protein
MANLIVEANGNIVVPTQAVYPKPCCGKSSMSAGNLVRLTYGDRTTVEDSPIVRRFIAAGALRVIETLPEPESEPEARSIEPVGDIRDNSDFELTLFSDGYPAEGSGVRSFGKPFPEDQEIIEAKPKRKRSPRKS